MISVDEDRRLVGPPIDPKTDETDDIMDIGPAKAVAVYAPAPTDDV